MNIFIMMIEMKHSRPNELVSNESDSLIFNNRVYAEKIRKNYNV